MLIVVAFALSFHLRPKKTPHNFTSCDASDATAFLAQCCDTVHCRPTCDLTMNFSFDANANIIAESRSLSRRAIRWSAVMPDGLAATPCFDDLGFYGNRPIQDEQVCRGEHSQWLQGGDCAGIGGPLVFVSELGQGVRSARSQLWSFWGLGVQKRFLPTGPTANALSARRFTSFPRCRRLRRLSFAKRYSASCAVLTKMTSTSLGQMRGAVLPTASLGFWRPEVGDTVWARA